MAILNGIYRDHPGLNQSLLKLMHIPQFFKRTMDNVRESGSKNHFVQGSFFDDLLLNSPTIWDKYIIVDLGSFNENYKKIVDDCFVLGKDIKECLPEMLIVYESLYSNNWKQETRKEAILKYCSIYWEKLNEINGRQVISNESYDIHCHNRDLLYPIISNCHHKVALTGIYKGIEIKGELDQLDIDRVNKTWRVMDDKTSEEPYKFVNSVLKFRYDFQAAFYENLVELNAEELGIVGYQKLPFIWNVVSSVKKGRLVRYENSFNAMQSGVLFDKPYMGVDEAIDRYIWHTKFNYWENSKEEFESGLIKIKTSMNYEEIN
jgi:hypothetical protein